MKALELTVYPKRRVTLEGFFGKPEHHFEYAVNGRLIDEQDIYPSIKRLTDAELAAEVWHSIVRFHGQNPGPKAAEEARRNMILSRFANLPHHDATPGLTAHQEGTQ